MVKRGVIAPGDRVVCILTGHLLKDPDATTGYHDGGGSKANPPVAIAPKLSEVERVLKDRKSG
jgi:threonine synthase